MNYTHNSNWLRRAFRFGVALLVLPVMVFLTGCDSDSDTNQEPDADFTFTVSDTNPTEVQFTDQSEDPDGEIQSYNWEFGDGTTSDEASPTKEYDNVGTFQVTLTVEDNEGVSDDVTKPVNLEDPGEPAGPNYANYDTTVVAGDTTIIFQERDNLEGVVPTATENNPDVRENYVKWTSNYEYVISGRTFVGGKSSAGDAEPQPDTLEIEPGTVVRGRPNQDPENASSLIVTRKGTILAEGTESDPIIFTAEEDDLSTPNDLSRNLDGAWGGVIILGEAPANFFSDIGLRNVEGIPSDVDRARFGGNNATDDSGIFKYVSIRYAGISIGQGNEINGLTMGAVGSGTTIEYVEVYNNADDGFEWFGGTVNARYLVASRVGDDSFDIDQGFSGSLQYLLAIQTLNRGDRTGEHDSGDDGFGDPGEADQPVSNPQIYNATYVGTGPNGAGDIGLKLRDNFAGDYFNSIFYSYPAEFIEVEDLDGNAVDSRGRWEADELTVNNSILWQFASVQDPNNPSFEALVENEGSWGSTVASDLQDLGVTYEDPGLTRDQPSNAFQSLNVVPTNSGVVSNNVAPVNTGDQSFLESASYKGAFDPNGGNWAEGWTFTDEVGIFN